MANPTNRTRSGGLISPIAAALLIVVQGCSLYRDGQQEVASYVQRSAAMRVWMLAHEYDSLHLMQGSMNHRACGDPSQFERTNYMQALQSFA